MKGGTNGAMKSLDSGGLTCGVRVLRLAIKIKYI